VKTLLMINGPMGVGKTAVCEKLLERLTPGVYLDGDWCWNMNPFLVTSETRAMVLDNITAMLSRFLACPELEYIIFGWVMHQPEIAQAILSRLDLKDITTWQYTLLCSEDTLRGRVLRDICAGLRDRSGLERSIAYLPLYSRQNTIKIMTDGLSPEMIAEQIVHMGEDC